MPVSNGLCQQAQSAFKPVPQDSAAPLMPEIFEIGNAPKTKAVKEDARPVPAVNAPYIYKVSRMRLWQSYLLAMGHGGLFIDETIPLVYEGDRYGDESINEDPQAAKVIKEAQQKKRDDHAHNPSVFLSKFMTDLHWLDKDGNAERIMEPEKIKVFPAGKRLVCTYEPLMVEYKPDKETLKFSILGIEGDINHDLAKTSEGYVNNVLIENIKGAMLLVGNAKASGWEKINFGDTTDPLKRYALKIACDYLDVDCSDEIIDMDALPKHTILGENIAASAEGARENYMGSPFETLAFKRTEEAPKQKKKFDADKIYEAALGL